MDDARKSPLRIHVYYDIKIPTDQTNFIKNTIMPPSVEFWSQALAVFPVQNNLLFDRTCSSTFELPDGTKKCNKLNDPETCGDGDAVLPVDWFKARESCTSCSTGGTCSGCVTSTGGVGLLLTDVALVVHVENTGHCSSSPSTLAYAYACKWDQYDRPILGHVNFCPAASAASSQTLQISTAKHEIAHALGFSSNSFPLMRHRDGKTPRTARDASTGAPAKSSVTCVDGTTKNIVIAASSSLKHGPMRGIPNTFSIVTETVRDVARHHFQCPSLEGIEVENQPTSAGACWGSHWEQRVLGTEAMTPVVSDDNPAISSFTLALFHDMGFYDVNFSKADPLLWGHKLGCDFVTKKCVQNGGTKVINENQGYFCNDTRTISCSHDLMAISGCDVRETTEDISEVTMQYFTGAPKKGGEVAVLDYCPSFFPFVNGGCVNANNNKPLATNYYGEKYGSSSRCVSSNALWKGYNLGAFQNVCMETSCLSSTSLKVTAYDRDNNRVSTTCNVQDLGIEKELHNEDLSIQTMHGKIRCPNVDIVCGQIFDVPTSPEPFVLRCIRPSSPATQIVSFDGEIGSLAVDDFSVSGLSCRTGFVGNVVATPCVKNGDAYAITVACNEVTCDSGAINLSNLMCTCNAGFVGGGAYITGSSTYPNCVLTTQCIAPNSVPSGYMDTDKVETSKDFASFSVSGWACDEANGYTGKAVASTCDRSTSNQYRLFGCYNSCQRPIAPLYAVGSETSLQFATFNVTNVSCVLVGTPIASRCTSSNPFYTLEGCADACTRPIMPVPGYIFANETGSMKVGGFNITGIVCNSMTHVGSATTFVCQHDSTAYKVHGCVSKCERPSAVGYNFNGETGSLSVSDFRIVGLTCAVGFVGTPTTRVCSGTNTEYLVSGCENTCSVPAIFTGYDLSNVLVGSLLVDDFAVTNVTCGAGYAGTATASVCAGSVIDYKLDGCFNTCIRPALTTTTTAYDFSAEKGDFSLASFDVSGVTCAAADAVGIASVSKCTETPEYNVIGCTKTCTVPTNKNGYNVDLQKSTLTISGFSIAVTCSEQYFAGKNVPISATVCNGTSTEIKFAGCLPASMASCENGVVDAAKLKCECSAKFEGGGLWISGSTFPACSAVSVPAMTPNKGDNDQTSSTATVMGTDNKGTTPMPFFDAPSPTHLHSSDKGITGGNVMWVDTVFLKLEEDLILFVVVGSMIVVILCSCVVVCACRSHKNRKNEEEHIRMMMAKQHSKVAVVPMPQSKMDVGSKVKARPSRTRSQRKSDASLLAVAVNVTPKVESLEESPEEEEMAGIAEKKDEDDDDEGRFSTTLLSTKSNVVEKAADRVPKENVEAAGEDEEKRQRYYDGQPQHQPYENGNSGEYYDEGYDQQHQLYENDNSGEYYDEPYENGNSGEYYDEGYDQQHQLYENDNSGGFNGEAFQNDNSDEYYEEEQQRYTEVSYENNNSGRFNGEAYENDNSGEYYEEEQQRYTEEPYENDNSSRFAYNDEAYGNDNIGEYYDESYDQHNRGGGEAFEEW